MPEDEELERPSRSQRKRDMLALFDLGSRLVDLSSGHLASLPIDEELREEILACKTMRHGARKRQLKLISKLIRRSDVEAIREGLAATDA